MLNRLLRCKEDIIDACQNNPSLAEKALTADEWNMVQELVQVFKPFVNAIRFLEGDNYITLSFVLPRLFSVKNSLLPSPPGIDTDFKTKIKAALLPLLLN